MPGLSFEDRFAPLLDRAVAERPLAHKPVLLRVLDGGKSTASVYCVHVETPPGSSFCSGEYILKLDCPSNPVRYDLKSLPHCVPRPCFLRLFSCCPAVATLCS